LAVEEWNARGGVLGKPIKLYMADDQGDPAEGAMALTLLIQQRSVVGIVGAPMTQVSLAVAPIVQTAGLPLIASASTCGKVTEVGDFIFRACLSDAWQGSIGAQFSFDELKARSAACLFDRDNDYPMGLAQVFRTAFTGLGGRVVAFEGHADRSPDSRAQISKVLKAAPDVIYVPDYYGDAALIMRKLRTLGYQGPILGADGWDSPRLLELSGQPMENAFFTTFFSPQDPRPSVQAFVEAYRAKYAEAPNGHAAMGYEATVILLDAIRRAGTTGGRPIRDAIAQTDLSVVTGPIRFDAHRNLRKPVVIMELKGGRPLFRAIIAPLPTGPPDGAASAPPALGHDIHSWR
jgi:branched-chain amino acid transport system substrate-binding protein